MYDELKRFSRILDRMEFYNESPTLEDLKELKQDIENENDTSHDDCFSSDQIGELECDRITELESEIESLKEQLAAKPKRKRKAKPSVDFESLEETRNRLSNEFAACKCEESRCHHWKRVETAEMWIKRGKELAS